ncbi:unnamed protein product [Rotaria sp. Silwood2]|nr:unnamed protein product [Rotaria sp. Silwood2]CAF4233885.1 unnamed protein product [Rotaria sp. Silwood2]
MPLTATTNSGFDRDEEEQNNRQKLLNNVVAVKNDACYLLEKMEPADRDNCLILQCLRLSRIMLSLRQ